MTFDLGGGKQVVVANGRLMLWANRGCLGVELSPEQQAEIGLAMFRTGRKAKRIGGDSPCPSRTGGKV